MRRELQAVHKKCWRSPHRGPDEAARLVHEGEVALMQVAMVGMKPQRAWFASARAELGNRVDDFAS